MNRLTQLLFLSFVASSVQPGLAADRAADSLRHIDVQFADLDLTRVAGADVLYRRLHQAAESVCAELNSKTPAEASRASACISNAMATAVAAINQPVMTAYYRHKLGRGNVVVRQAAN